MKHTIFLIFLVTLISCKQKTEVQESKEKLNFYEIGMKNLQELDSLGKPNYRIAIINFDKAIRENPEDINPRYWKAHCELNSGKFNDALQTSISAINQFKDTNERLLLDLYTMAGIIEKINNNTSKSNLYFSEALIIIDSRINSTTNDIDALMNKAIILCYLDKKEDAITFINSIPVTEENQALLTQTKENLYEFNADEAIGKIKNNVW